tara:strand:- start:816 stop:1001 length:186 start_codon:yes stop_codon:yes gene_type:complete
MADKEIHSQKEFFEEVRLDEDGNLISLVVEQSGSVTNSENRTDFFNRVALDENGKLKIIFV